MSKQSGNSDVVFDLDAAAFSSDEFRIYQFKVEKAPAWGGFDGNALRQLTVSGRYRCR
jgi:hypothetical protein